MYTHLYQIIEGLDVSKYDDRTVKDIYGDFCTFVNHRADLAARFDTIASIHATLYFPNLLRNMKRITALKASRHNIRNELIKTEIFKRKSFVIHHYNRTKTGSLAVTGKKTIPASLSTSYGFRLTNTIIWNGRIRTRSSQREFFLRSTLSSLMKRLLMTKSSEWWKRDIVGKRVGAIRIVGESFAVTKIVGLGVLQTSLPNLGWLMWRFIISFLGSVSRIG